MKHTRYFQNLLLGLDEFGNTLLGSGRAGRAAQDGRLWGRFLCYLLGKIDPNRCAKAVENDAKGRHKESLNIE